MNLKEGFIAYLNDYYLDIICKDIYKYAEQNNQQILIVSRIIKDFTSLDDDEPELTFKIKIDTEYLLPPKSYTKTFVVEYKCILDDGIKELTCLGVEPAYKRKFKYDNELSKYMIPYISKTKYEEYGTRFAKKYLKDKYQEYPVDVDAIVLEMNLKTIISNDLSLATLGSTIFKNCEFPFIDFFSNEEKKEKLQKGTIIVNVRNILMTGNDNLVRSTTIHECLHWHFHKKAFEILMLLNDEYKYINCVEYKGSEQFSEMFNLMEAQANALTPVVLMDKDNVNEELYLVLSKFNNTPKLENLTRIDSLREVASELASIFRVTLNAMVKRLVSLSYDDFAPLQNKNSVKNFVPTLSEKNLSEKQSRCINEDQLKVLYEHEPVLKYLLDEKIFKFVNGYVVFNNEKYIQGEASSLELTNYAKDNISECSILFNTEWDFTRKESFNEFSVLTLNRLGREGVCYVSMPSSEISTVVKMVEKRYPEERKRRFFKDFRTPVPNKPFSDYLIYLMEKRKVTIGELVSRSGCSESSIKRYRKFDNDSYSIEVVLAIAAGLKCYPYETYNLLALAGFNIDTDSKRHKVYKCLVEDYYYAGIAAWNAYLEKHGVHKLSSA